MDSDWLAVCELLLPALGELLKDCREGLVRRQVNVLDTLMIGGIYSADLVAQVFEQRAVS